MAKQKDDGKLITSQTSSEIEESSATDESNNKATPANQKDKANFPIVGIGASAGGLDALQELFTSLPSNIGM